MALLSAPGGGAAKEEVRIREAREEDAPAIAALVASLAGRFLADPDDPGAAAPFFESISPGAVAERIRGAAFRHHVAEVGGALAGVVVVRDASHLYHLFVAAPLHGRGIARRLWGVAREAALAAGGSGRFTVNSSLPAVPVYERFGFVADGEAVVKDGLAYLPMATRVPAPERGGIRLLREVFGEPERPPESFARAIGPERLVPLAARIGPGEVASSVPASPPPHRSLPHSAPAARPAPHSAPAAGRVPGSLPPG